MYQDTNKVGKNEYDHIDRLPRRAGEHFQTDGIQVGDERSADKNLVESAVLTYKP